MAKLVMTEALNLAMREEMARDKSVLILGEDVGVDGGVFRVTKGLQKEFGKDRVVDTPLAEGAIVGAAVGLAVYGKRPVCEIQFSGFIYEAFHQLKDHASRFRFRTQGRYTVPMVLRSPYGAGIRALEHHSESTEMYYAHTPGLKVVIPSGPRNARALLKAAIRDPDPVIFLEPMAIYRAFREEIPEEDEVMPIGKCQIVREGNDLTLVAFGAMLHQVLQVAEQMASAKGIQCEVIDVRTISPLDSDTIVNSVRKTGRCVVVHEATRTGGIGAEIIARINEDALESLEAPVARVTSYDVPVPLYAREAVYMPDPERIAEGIERTVAF